MITHSFKAGQKVRYTEKCLNSLFPLHQDPGIKTIAVAGTVMIRFTDGTTTLAPNIRAVTLSDRLAWWYAKRRKVAVPALVISALIFSCTMGSRIEQKRRHHAIWLSWEIGYKTATGQRPSRMQFINDSINFNSLLDK